MRTLLASLLILTGCATPHERSMKPVDEAGWILLGGIEQWVTIRGEDAGNPVLLHVHGGPGFATSAFTEEFALYESDFTVVQWDQRGAGRTFGRHGEDTPGFTLDRIAQDGIELAAYLEERLGDRPIVVLGHSLGTFVGIMMVQRAPERFSAYVGTSQFSDFQAAFNAQLAYLHQIGATDDSLRSQLDAIGTPDPASLQDFFSLNRTLSAHVPADDAAWFARLQARLPEVMTPEERVDWSAGREASADALMPQTVNVDLFTSAPNLRVPFILIQGRDDIYTPTALAIEYLEQVEAPRKMATIIDGAAHFPQFTHPGEYLAALRAAVLPLVTFARRDP